MNIFSIKNRQTKNRRKGVALLIAVLLASVMLSVGLGLYQRTYKQILFSSFWEQEQIAFAGADGGLECALYWDLHQLVNSATCFGTTVPGWNPSLNISTSFTINIPTVCLTVEITKNAVTPFTTIQSHGYNTCDSTSPRRVERGLRIDY